MKAQIRSQIELLDRRSQTLGNRAGRQKALRALHRGTGGFCAGARRIEAFTHDFAGLKEGDGLLTYWHHHAADDAEEASFQKSMTRAWLPEHLRPVNR